jgi:hypothetical protein
VYIYIKNIPISNIFGCIGLEMGEVEREQKRERCAKINIRSDKIQITFRRKDADVA